MLSKVVERFLYLLLKILLIVRRMVLGEAMINLLFVAHAIMVFIGSIGLFGLLSSHKNLRHAEASGPWLAQLESDSSLMLPVPEFELE